MADDLDTSPAPVPEDAAEPTATTEPVEVEPSAEDAQSPAGTERPSRRRRILMWGALGVLGVLLAGILIPGFSVTQAGYYRRYPGLDRRMDYWAHSTHSKMSCVDCHVEPGVGAFVTFAAKAIPAFYSQLITGPTDTNLLGAPGRKACEKCHTKYREVAPSGDLLIPHRAHVQVLGMECGECHKNLVHSLNRRGFNRPEMEDCLKQCHDGKTASNECVDCHTQKNAPKSHKETNWLEVHGRQPNMQECAQCHDWTPKYCEECHKQRPASHAGNWKKDHAAPAKARGDGCLVCHDEQKFCGECH